MTKGQPRANRKPNPLAVSAGYRQFVLDQLEAVGDVTARSMFGGVGLYHHSDFFGIIADDTLYLKVDDTTRPAYITQGMRPFDPYRGRGATFQYYEVPLEVLESAPELARWAKAAIEIARRRAEVDRAKPPG